MSDPNNSPAAQKAQDLAHAARSGGMQVLTILSQAILPLTHVVVARLFGTVVFGAYQNSLAVIEMATRGGTGGADKAMLRYVAGFRGRGDEAGVESAIGTGLRQCFGIAGPLVLFLMLGAPLLARLLHEPELAISLPAMAPAVLLTGLMVSLVQASLAARVTRANFIVRGLGEPSFLFLAGVLAALLGRTLGHLAIAHSLAALATCALAVVMVGRVFGQGQLRRALRAKRLPGFASFALPMGGSELLNTVLQRTDIVMLTYFCGARATGIYAAAEFLGRSVANIRYAFDSIAAGVFSEAVHRGERDRLRDNLTLMTRWVVTVSAPVAVLVIALRQVLLGLYGAEFVAGSTAMVILTISHLVNASLGLTPWMLMVSGHSRLLLLDNLICACLNIVLGLLLIPRLQIVGTALSVLLTIVFFQLLMLWQTWRTERVHPFNARLLRPLLSAAVMLGAMLLAAPYSHKAAGWMVQSVGGLALYAGMLWVLGLPPEERQLLDKLRVRLMRRR